ncbi:MAG: hypothetical protein V2J20_07895 [Wenzhouxiangella sp.]|nr:hypothetical protein [Wenzhouxiangella sp.]
MSGDDFSFSFSMPAAPQQPARRAPRYIARPFEAHPVGDQTLILGSGSDHSVPAPLFYAQMLAHCDRFKTLDEHADSVVSSFGLPAEQRAAVRQGLAGLVERDLLQAEQTVFESLVGTQQTQKSQLGPLRTLCIRTCNRPDDLARLFDSLKTHVRETSLERVLILDDASEPEAVDKTAQAIAAAEVGRWIRLIHIDRARRSEMLRHIASESGVELGQLHWLIEGDPEDSEASYGANLNLALLLTAGERFLMIDDDAGLQPFALEPPRNAISLRVENDFKVRFPTDQIPEVRQYKPLDINPINEHARVLGEPLGTLARSQGLQDGHLLQELSPQMIHDFSARPRIRLSTNGTLGDSGTGSMLWQYTLPAEQLAGWQEDEGRYRREAFGRRVARSTLETQIGSSVSLMTTTLTGVDNRELLLPVPAKGRGEDLIFGIGIRFLYPGTPCCALPWMLPHRQESSRRWSDEDLERQMGAGLTDFIASKMEDLAETTLPERPSARSRVLASYFIHLAAMDEPQLVNQVRRHLLQRRANLADRVKTTLNSLNAPAPWLEKDLLGIIERHSQIQPEDTAKLELLVAPFQSFCKHFGQALPSWIKAWQWAETVDLVERLEQ